MADDGEDTEGNEDNLYMPSNRLLRIKKVVLACDGKQGMVEIEGQD
jgi:hypothetical protein